MPLPLALHFPEQGPDPWWWLGVGWQGSAAFGDPHGEAKGDLGREGKGWNMLGPAEPALDMCIIGSGVARFASPTTAHAWTAQGCLVRPPQHRHQELLQYPWVGNHQQPRWQSVALGTH